MKKMIGLIGIALAMGGGYHVPGTSTTPTPERKNKDRIPEKLPEPSKPRNNPKKLSRKKRKMK